VSLTGLIVEMGSMTTPMNKLIDKEPSYGSWAIAPRNGCVPHTTSFGWLQTS